METTEQIIQQSTNTLSFLGKDYQIFRMAGDASSREYYRILYGNKQSCILMLLPEGASSLAEEYESEKLQTKELPFLDVQRLFISKDIRVPEVYVEDVAHRILLLEDLGDTLLIDAIQNDAEKSLQAAIQLLAKIANPSPAIKKTSIAFQRSFDETLYMWEFQHYIEYGIEKMLDYHDTDISKLKDLFYKITQQYTSWDKHLTHRDYHAKNIHVMDKDALAVIDFQDALLGPVYYDLASLLKDAYTKVDRSLQEKLALSYRNILDNTIKDAKLSNDEFLFRFDVMSLHRNLKAAGRFVYIDQVKDNPNYLKDVPQALSYATETVKIHPELRQLKNILEPYMQALMEEV